jgi:hypothetical protein
MGGTCGTYGKEINAYRALVWKPEGNNHLEDLDVDGKMLLVKWVSMNGIVGGGFIWLRTGTRSGLL